MTTFKYEKSPSFIKALRKTIKENLESLGLYIAEGLAYDDTFETNLEDIVWAEPTQHSFFNDDEFDEQGYIYELENYGFEHFSMTEVVYYFLHDLYYTVYSESYDNNVDKYIMGAEIVVEKDSDNWEDTYVLLPPVTPYGNFYKYLIGGESGTLNQFYLTYVEEDN